MGRKLVLFLFLFFFAILMVLFLGEFDIFPDEYALTIQVEGEGSVPLGEGDHTYEKGKVVDLTATTEEGWEFKEWIGDVAEAESVDTTVLMDGDKTVKAVFMLDSTRAIPLEPGKEKETPEGSLIGAMEDAPVDEMLLFIKDVEDPRSEISLPYYLNDLNIIGEFYEMSASQEFMALDETFVIIGFPVPEGTNTDKLALLSLAPPENVTSIPSVNITTPPTTGNESARWYTRSGTYDPENKIFLTGFCYIGEDTPEVLVLVEGIDYGTSVSKTQSTSEFTVAPKSEFMVVSKGFNEGVVLPEHIAATEYTLNEALNTYRELGFDDPFLRRRKEISLSLPRVVTFHEYIYELHPIDPEDENKRGRYRNVGPITANAHTRYDPSVEYPPDSVTRHELFHAVQFAYLSFLGVPRFNYGYAEGTAELAAYGLRSEYRYFERYPLMLNNSIFTRKGGLLFDPPPIGADYSTVYFWAYLSHHLDDKKGDSFLVDIVEKRGSKKDIDEWLKDSLIFDGLSDAYWQFVKDYAMEKETILGEGEVFDDRDAVQIPFGDKGQRWFVSNPMENITLNIQPGETVEEDLVSKLKPLSSRLFLVTIDAPTDGKEYQVEISIESDNSMVKFKVYDTTENIDRWQEQEAATIIVHDEAKTLDILISNTDLNNKVDGIKVTAYSEKKISPHPGDQTSHTVNGIDFNMRLAPAATFPTGVDDDGEGTVDDDFWVGETQVTYELWYEVRMWAEGEGYTFANAGREGSDGDTGEEPSSKKNEPVTMVNWYDSIVWCNAISEMLGYDPVYTIDGDVLRDSEELRAERLHEDVEAEDNNGFRLPTSMEWELAARYQGSDSSHGAIEYPAGSGNYWTPGNYASGATDDYNNAAATQAAAWYGANSGRKTQDVGQKPSGGNGLGVFDMSGNVWEWCFCVSPWSGSDRVLRGGSWFSTAAVMQVGNVSSNTPSFVYVYFGLRFLRTHF